MEIVIIFLSIFILFGESFQTNLTISSRATCGSSTAINNYYCSGSLNLYAEGIWVTVDERWTVAPEFSVAGGSDQNGNTYYVIRAQFGDNGIVVGKWIPKEAFIPYGGLEHKVTTGVAILIQKNNWWGDVTDDASKWIPGGIGPSGNVIYICKIQLPITVDTAQHTVPGKYDNGRCYVSWQGKEIGFDNGFNVLRQSLS